MLSKAPVKAARSWGVNSAGPHRPEGVDLLS
jgi:hypothetical protein